MNIPKFRAWDKVNKRMISSEKIVGIDFENECIGYRKNKGDKIITFFPKFKDIELMQSTNLPDKNKAEIFEGDIVESRASQNKEDWKRWKVYFEDGSFVFEHKWIIRKKEYSMKEFLCEDEIEFYHLEVIGNIYENPELLEGVKQ